MKRHFQLKKKCEEKRNLSLRVAHKEEGGREREVITAPKARRRPRRREKAAKTLGRKQGRRLHTVTLLTTRRGGKKALTVYLPTSTKRKKCKTRGIM